MQKMFFVVGWVCVAACNTNPKTISSSAKPANTSASIEVATEDDLSILQAMIADPPQTFIVPAKTIKLIEGKNGLRVTVDPSRLETLKGEPVTGDVTLTIKELLKAHDMIAENTPTVSDGRLLSSGGSYYIGIKSKGEELRIKKGQTLQMQFPQIANKEMELFYGERNEAGIMNWKRMNQQLSNTVKRNKAIVTDERFQAFQPQLTTSAFSSIGVDATKGYRASKLWLKLYEDSIMDRRRDYVKTNYQHMTQQTIGKLMQDPLLISRKDAARLRMEFTYTPEKKNTRIHLTNDMAYYLVETMRPDSILYYKDSVKFALGEIKPVVKENSNYSFGDNGKGSSGYNDYSYTPTNDINVDIIPAKKTNGEQDTKKEIKYYQPVEIANLGWINCDRFYEAEEYVPQYTFNIKGKVPKEIGVYAIFRDINSMMCKRVRTEGEHTIIIEDKIPLNSRVEFLFFSKVDNQFVQYKQTATVTKNLVIPVEFAAVPVDNIKTAFLN